MARRIMTEFRLEEISAVDKPAQEHAKMTIMKRDDPRDPPKPPIEEPPPSTADKRVFSQAQRDAAAASGAAEDDGSYPILDRASLHDAIQAYGRSKNKPKTKAHIISRARSLGATAMLPAGWTSKRYDKSCLTEAIDAFEASDEISHNDFTRDELIIIGKALTAGDAVETAEDGHSLETAEMAGSDNIEKDAPAAVDAASVKELEILRKSLETLERENAILKMAPEHRQYMEDVHMDEDAKSFFLKADKSSRDSIMKSNPIEKKLPPAIQKLLDEAAKDKEVLKILKEKDDILTFSKKAEDLGSPAAFGEVLRKAYSGDEEAIGELERHIKSLNAQIKTGKIFDEFGTSRGATAEPYDLLKAKASDLRKVMPNLTEQQAFMAVYEDPANRDIVKEYKKHTPINR